MVVAGPVSVVLDALETDGGSLTDVAQRTGLRLDVVRAAAAHLVRLGRVQRCELQFGCASVARCGDCTLACGARPDTLGR